LPSSTVSAKIIQQTHLSQPAAFALFVAVSNWLSTILCLRLIDRLGRRYLLLRTLVGMVIGMSLLAFSFAMLPHFPTEEGVVEGVVQAATAVKPSPWAFVTIFAMIIFCSSYAPGLGNCAWYVLLLLSPS
jgi:SP family myo-inositol transporter-like MFS transporter 13